MIARLRQWLCTHEFLLGNIYRISPKQVACRCRRCGKLVTAPYGIALPGKIV